MKKIEQEKIRPLPEDILSRKEWLQKAGKYTAFTAAGMMMILKPVKSSANDGTLPQNPPVW